MSDVASAIFVGGVNVATSAEPYHWVEGGNYTTSQSFWMPNRDQVLDVDLWAGQSYTNGGSIAAGTAHNTSPVYPGYAKMLSAGVDPGANTSTGIVDMVGTPNAEPPALEATRWMCEQLAAKFGTPVRRLALICSGSGFRYNKWKKGSPIWNILQARMIEIRNYATAMGLFPIVRLAYGCGGESDATQIYPAVAAGHIRQFRQDLQDEAMRIFGQTDTIKFVAYANNRASSSTLVETAWPIAMDMLSRNEPELYALAGPSYAVETDGTNHPTVLGYRELGIMMARAGLHLAYGTGRHGLRVKRAYWINTTSIRLDLEHSEGLGVHRDDSNVRVGYSSNPADPYYIGPVGSGDAGASTARDGGIYIKDRTGIFGVLAATVSGSLGIVLALSRAGHQGSTEILGAQFCQNVGFFDGSNANCARMIFRTNDAGLAVPGSSYPLRDWLLPFHIRL
jgi:hypothetical protein